MSISDPNARPPLNQSQSDPSRNRLVGWIAKLKPETLKDRSGPELQNLLESLSQQHVPPDKGYLGLMVLLAHEEFAAFVDTFNMLHKLEAAHHPIDKGPYKSTLHLSLPCDWKATDLPGMLDALSRIQVDILEAHPPYHPKYERLLPEAVCHAIAALLQAGVTDLRMDGVPNHPLEIAKAFQGSQLESITLGGDGLHESIVTEEDMKSFDTLVQGLAGCTQLKKLVIDHPQLLKLHAGVAVFSTLPHGPKLEEVGVGSVLCRPDEVKPFLLTLRQLFTLSDIQVVTRIRTVGTLKTELLDPLRGHPSMKRLALASPSKLPLHKDSDQFVPTLLSFAATCPHLRHVALSNFEMPWDGAFGAVQKFLSSGGTLDAPNAAEATAQAFAQEVALTSLALGGVLLTPVVVTAMAQGLERNTLLESFDVSVVLTDLESFLRLLDAVKKSKSIRNFVIPEGLENLYFLSPDGSTHRFEPRPLLSLDGKPLPFKLMFHAGVTDKEKATANKALALLEERANNIAVDIETHRRRMLEPLISDFMNAAMLAQPQGANYSFSEVAPNVVSALAKSDLSTAFRLNELKKPQEVEGAQTTTTTTTSTGTTTTTGLQPSREQGQ